MAPSLGSTLSLRPTVLDYRPRRGAQLCMLMPVSILNPDRQVCRGNTANNYSPIAHARP